MFTAIITDLPPPVKVLPGAPDFSPGAVRDQAGLAGKSPVNLAAQLGTSLQLG